MINKTAISTAVVAALSLGAAGTASAVTVTLLDNTAPQTGIFAAPNDGVFNGAYDVQGSAPNEFRVMNGGGVSGGGEKSIVNGNQTWTFDGAGVLTAVAGTDVVPAAAPNGGGGAGQGGVGLFQNAEFLFPGGFFGFVAPLAGTDVLANFGAATIAFDSTDNFTMFFPVMEAHWSNGTFTIGGSNGGVTFNCTGANGGVGHCSAERQLAAIDDSLGFAGQFMQWEFNVSVDPAHTSVIPVPAAVWLLGSGLIGLVGVARRRKSS